MNRPSSRINDGSRPGHLELDARATGERPGPLPAAHRAALEVARAQTPPFDWAILQARAHRIRQETPDPAAAASRPQVAPAGSRGGGWRRGLVLVPLLAAAASALFVWVPGEDSATRGGGAPEAYLETFVLREGSGGAPWSPALRLQEGDRVQFAYDAQGTGETLVLMSVDGEGVLSVFWPESGDLPVAVVPSGEALLEGSVALDDARGPEVFVAVFGAERVSEAQAWVWERWQDDGVEGLLALDDEEARVAVVVIEKVE